VGVRYARVALVLQAGVPMVRVQGVHGIQVCQQMRWLVRLVRMHVFSSMVAVATSGSSRLLMIVPAPAAAVLSTVAMAVTALPTVSDRLSLCQRHVAIVERRGCG
jgi:hypothetical protein